jgi:hypothetical protein
LCWILNEYIYTMNIQYALVILQVCSPTFLHHFRAFHRTPPEKKLSRTFGHSSTQLPPGRHIRIVSTADPAVRFSSFCTLPPLRSTAREATDALLRPQLLPEGARSSRVQSHPLSFSHDAEEASRRGGGQRCDLVWPASDSGSASVGACSLMLDLPRASLVGSLPTPSLSTSTGE